MNTQEPEKKSTLEMLRSKVDEKFVLDATLRALLFFIPPPYSQIILLLSGVYSAAVVQQRGAIAKANQELLEGKVSALQQKINDLLSEASKFEKEPSEKLASQIKTQTIDAIELSESSKSAINETSVMALAEEFVNNIKNELISEQVKTSIEFKEVSNGPAVYKINIQSPLRAPISLTQIFQRMLIHQQANNLADEVSNQISSQAFGFALDTISQEGLNYYRWKGRPKQLIVFPDVPPKFLRWPTGDGPQRHFESKFSIDCSLEKNGSIILRISDDEKKHPSLHFSIKFQA